MANSDITIREATLDDVIGIVYVQATTWIAAYPNQDNGINEADIRSIDFHGKVREWQHMLQSLSYKVWVAAKASKIIGILAARKDDSNEIYEQCVLPEHQRRGVGSRLFQEALNWLGEDKPITLRIISYNQDGVAFYQKFGFKISELGEVDFIRLPTGKNIPTLEMRRGAVAPIDQLEEVDETEPIKEKEAAEIDRPIAGSVLENKPELVPKLVGRSKLAKLAKLRPSTIKYYTEIGLLPFEQQEKRLARRYNVEPALVRLKEIKQLRGQGLSIKEIQPRFNPNH